MIKNKAVRVLLAVGAMSLLPMTDFGQQASKAKNALPTSLEIIDNWTHTFGESNIRSRFIFLYLPERDFTVSNLELILGRYRAEFCDPYILQMDIYSDKASLEKKIKWEKRSYAIDFKDDTVGRRAASEYYARVLPSGKGYFWAEYSRYSSFEFFDYNKSKNNPEPTRVMLDSDSTTTPCRSR